MRVLLDAFPSGRVIVLLDNLEDVIDSSSADLGLTDPVLDEALRTLLSAPPHAVKVIVTTRVAPKGLLLEHPERQRPLDLDEGLASPHAEQVLRARDPDGRLGLKLADDGLPGKARERTRGYPRALEALAAILSADRGTTLQEFLADTAALPGNVVQALVGEAFSRLDPLAQQVMQALAVYPVPVPPVAVDYLLQPSQPTIDAAPVLRRLVEHAVRPPRGLPATTCTRWTATTRCPGCPKENLPTGTRILRRLPGRLCDTAAETTSSRPVPRGRTGRAWMIWVRSWPSSSCGHREATTTLRLRCCSASTSTT